MTPQPESWLERAKRLEPVKLARTVKAVLAVGSLLGYIGLTQADVTFLGTQLEVILPAIGAVVWPVVEWLAARWLRSKVSPEATTEPMAEAILEATQNPSATPSPAAVKAAQRVVASEK